MVPVKRSPLKQKTPLRKVSAKRRAYRASEAGQEALEYMRRVKALPCVICGSPPPSDAHHCIHDRYGSRKASDFDVIPLCRECHLDGPEAIHNGKQTWRDKHGPDHGYLPLVKRLLGDM
jgi:5-methylcytosine-specific restriction endonuclease McrA